MKKLLGLLLFVTFFVFPLSANAYIIGNLNLTETASGLTGNATFPSNTAGNWYFDYDVSLSGSAKVEAFCVEDANAPTGTNLYTLLSIDSGLNSFGLVSDRYLAAAWVADKYFTTYENTDESIEDPDKAAAQLLIWEIIFDGTAIDFNSGVNTFRSTAASTYSTQINAIWNARPDTFPTFSTTWALAVNPTVLPDGTIISKNDQNYLVRKDVSPP